MYVIVDRVLITLITLIFKNIFYKPKTIKTSVTSVSSLKKWLNINKFWHTLLFFE